MEASGHEKLRRLKLRWSNAIQNDMKETIEQREEARVQMTGK